MKCIELIFAYTYALTVGVIGVILYYLSKILRSLGYLCMLKVNSARSEFTDFFKVSYGSGDF